MKRLPSTTALVCWAVLFGAALSHRLPAQSGCPGPDPLAASTCSDWTNTSNYSSGDFEKSAGNIHSGPYKVSGNATVKWQAADAVHLDDQFEADPGSGYFHAYGVHAEILEPTPVSGTVTVPQFAKLEIGLKMPPALERRLDSESLNPACLTNFR